MLISRLKEESKWSQSYYAYLCGGKCYKLLYSGTSLIQQAMDYKILILLMGWLN